MVAARSLEDQCQPSSLCQALMLNWGRRMYLLLSPCLGVGLSRRHVAARLSRWLITPAFSQAPTGRCGNIVLVLACSDKDLVQLHTGSRQHRSLSRASGAGQLDSQLPYIGLRSKSNPASSLGSANVVSDCVHTSMQLESIHASRTGPRKDRHTASGSLVNHLLGSAGADG